MVKETFLLILKTIINMDADVIAGMYPIDMDKFLLLQAELKKLDIDRLPVKALISRIDDADLWQFIVALLIQSEPDCLIAAYKPYFFKVKS